jgi:RNA polymerase sigma factor (sigma-70 family)
VAEITDLVQRWQAGDPAAAEGLFRQYAEKLVRVAEQQLARKLLPRLDGEDVVQSVFRTFFRRCAEGQFHIDSSGQLWRLLVKITLLKARAKGRFHTAEQRDVGVENAGDAWLGAAAAHEPAPEDGAMLLDLMEALVHDLPPTYREILHQRLEGREVTEIAARLNLSRRTIQRALNLLQQRLASEDS